MSLKRCGPAIVAVLIGLLFNTAAFSAMKPNPHNLGSCTVCHVGTPQFGIDTRKTITFMTTRDDPGQCLSCHTSEQTYHPMLVPAAIGPGGRPSPYLPAGSSAAFDGKIVCISCHFIHAADSSYGLLRGFPGTSDPRYFTSRGDFCKECHGEELRRRSPHKGGEKACAFCHSHKPRTVNSSEIRARGQDLCLLCHDQLKKDHFTDANPFEERRACPGCHDPHAMPGNSPSLLSQAYFAAAQDNVGIRPHYRPGFCFACHTNPDDYALRDENINALCDRCHASGKIAANIHPLRKVPPNMTVPQGWPLTNGELNCLTCHEQGHEDQKVRPKMLRGGPYPGTREVCQKCHSRSDLQSSTIHKDVNEGKRCEVCHKTKPIPGKDNTDTVTFIADPDILCFRCHDVYYENPTIHHLMLLRREIPGDKMPAGFPLFKGRVICGSCHNPHLLQSQGYRLREWLEGLDFCQSCHKQ